MAKKDELHITKEQLEKIINMYGDIDKAECVNEANGQFRYTIKNIDGTFDINVFFKKNNTITCNAEGTDSEKCIGGKLVDLIYEKANEKDIRSGVFKCKISENNMESLIKYLKNLTGVKLVKDEDKGNNGHIYKFLDEIGDSITLTYYNNSTMLFQGYLMQLHTEVKCFLSAYDYVKTEVEKQEGEDIVERENNVVSLIRKYLPNSYDNLNEYLKNQLYDSFNLIVLHNEMKEYSSWTFHGLKALEGRIKEIFEFEGIHIDDKHGFRIKLSKNFVPLFIFDEVSKRHVLNSNVINITDINTASVLSDAYTYLNKNRSEIFHTRQVMKDTRRITTPEEAETIIFEASKIIEDSYNKLGK